MVLTDDFEKLRFLFRCQFFLEVAHDVLQDVGVLGCRGMQRQSLHQQFFVTAEQLRRCQLLAVRHQHPHPAIIVRAVRHHQQFVGGVKLDQLSQRRCAGQKVFPAPITEDPLDKIFAQRRIAQSPFLLHRQLREVIGHSRGKETAAVLHRHTVIVNLDAKEAGTRGILLEDKTAEILLL